MYNIKKYTHELKTIFDITIAMDVYSVHPVPWHSEVGSAGRRSAVEAPEFEHRDLHITNILLKKKSQKLLCVKRNGEEFTIPTHGVKATIKLCRTMVRIH